MNLKRVSIRNEIFIRRGLSILNSIYLPCKYELSLKCRSGLKLNPDSCELPPRVCSLYISVRGIRIAYFAKADTIPSSRAGINLGTRLTLICVHQ